MKLKKGPKKILVGVLCLLLIAIAGLIAYKYFLANKVTKKAVVVNTIKDYNYTLKDTKSSEYKKMFFELQKLLSSKSVSEDKYVKKISEMFVYDFYTLSSKLAKTDVGGADFVYSGVLSNFLLKAEDTYYKYVESNIYNNRKQSLPTVDCAKIKIVSVSQEEYGYGDKTDSKAYKVKVNWKYTSNKYDDYQKEATLVFIHNNKRLDLVELS